MRMGTTQRRYLGGLGIVGIAVGIILILWTAKMNSPQGSVPSPQPPPGKIESSLVQLMQQKLARGAEGAQEKVRVTIALQRPLSPEDQRVLEAAGAEIEIVTPWAVEALTPYGKLADVANPPFVKIVHLPLKPQKLP